MDAKNAMKTVYEVVKRAKDFSAKGTDIAISPKDFRGITMNELDKKMSELKQQQPPFNLFLNATDCKEWLGY